MNREDAKRVAGFPQRPSSVFLREPRAGLLIALTLLIVVWRLSSFQPKRDQDHRAIANDKRERDEGVPSHAASSVIGIKNWLIPAKYTGTTVGCAPRGLTELVSNDRGEPSKGRNSDLEPGSVHGLPASIVQR